MEQSEFYRGLECASTTLPHHPTLSAAPAVHAALTPLLGARPDGPPTACRAGCAACCHFPVGISYPEAFHLAAALAKHPALEETVLTRARQLESASWHELIAQPCPLLQNDLCALHAQRPIPCRAMASSDAQACAAALTDGTTPPLDAVAYWRGLGAAAALAQGQVPGIRELRAALLAMQHADANLRAASFLAARQPPD